ncbi:hypothetical protein [Vibrio neptunius]|uniref:hypothetical protein n=1 Tax=Vibrio neptunius TaxID=170651 RepID=UPI001C5C9DA7|nr:hypothetical protein [Vibrio neptunius]QXX06778.1 hypothetical protein KW548_01110 [Vibrio neptunius]
MARLVCFMVFAVLVSSVGIADTLFQYITIFVCMPLIFLVGLASGPIKFKLDKIIDILPLFIILSWVYGLALGIFNGNEPVNVIRNFFGMSLYILYYVFVIFSIPKISLLKTLLYASLLNALYSLGYFFNYWFLGGMGNQSIDFDGGLSAVYRSYYSVGLLVHLPIIALLLLYLFSGAGLGQLSIFKRRTSMFFVLLCLSFSLVGTTASKGFLLSLVALGLIIAIILSLRSVFARKIHGGAIWSLFAGIAFSAFVIGYTDVGQQITYSFSSAESSNSVRNEQREKIFDEINVFGSGLGATLKSGYKRDDSGYGFEVTYENLFHKLGVISIGIFAVFLGTCWVSAANIYRGVDIEYSTLSLGLMMYLIPSAGNPMLFSPICVTMHCIAMYLLRGRSYEVGHAT